MLCVSAQPPNVTVDFENGAGGFIPAGDLNADGSVNANDLVVLKRVLLGTKKQSYKEVYTEIGVDAKYSDANGDYEVDIRDLIRAKKNAAKSFINATGGKNGTAGMNVYGNVAFSGTLSKKLEKDRYYQVSFDYKSDDVLKITVNGISNQIYAFESEAAADWATKTYLIGTAENFDDISDIEVQICGNGAVDNITITPCTVDNDLADSW